jgi:hypothetical protein
MKSSSAGKAGNASLFAMEHCCPGLPDPGRWANTKRMTRNLTAVCLAALLIGCAHRWSVCQYSRDVIVTTGQEVQLGNQRVRLASIAPDGSATLALVGSGQSLSAAPGDFFVSEAFGTEGLQLVSVSPEQTHVTLRQRWADTK